MILGLAESHPSAARSTPDRAAPRSRRPRAPALVRTRASRPGSPRSRSRASPVAGTARSLARRSRSAARGPARRVRARPSARARTTPTWSRRSHPRPAPRRRATRSTRHSPIPGSATVGARTTHCAIVGRRKARATLGYGSVTAAVVFVGRGFPGDARRLSHLAGAGTDPGDVEEDLDDAGDSRPRRRRLRRRAGPVVLPAAAVYPAGRAELHGRRWCVHRKTRTVWTSSTAR